MGGGGRKKKGGGGGENGMINGIPLPHPPLIPFLRGGDIKCSSSGNSMIEKFLLLRSQKKRMS